MNGEVHIAFHDTLSLFTIFRERENLKISIQSPVPSDPEWLSSKMSPLWNVCTPRMGIVCKVPLTRSNDAEGEPVQQNGTAAPSSIPVPLWKLCEEGRLDEVREALANGVSVNSRSEDNTTGLMLALKHHHNYIVEFLLEQPSLDLNIITFSGKTALHFAAESGNVEGLRLLLDNPRFRIAQQRDNMGNTPKMLAMARNQMDSLRELITRPSFDPDTMFWELLQMTCSLRQHLSLRKFANQAERIVLEERLRRIEQAAEAI